MPVITLNGRREKFADIDFPATVLQLLQARGLDPGSVAVELDGEVVVRERYAVTRLAPGSVVEIVRFMGGG